MLIIPSFIHLCTHFHACKSLGPTNACHHANKGSGVDSTSLRVAHPGVLSDRCVCHAERELCLYPMASQPNTSRYVPASLKQTPDTMQTMHKAGWSTSRPFFPLNILRDMSSLKTSIFLLGISSYSLENYTSLGQVYMHAYHCSNAKDVLTTMFTSLNA